MFDETGAGKSSHEEIKDKLRANFDGKIVRKDLTKKIKEGANVPIYVLEFLLGQYCSSDDPELIESGVQTVKRILADNFVRPDEAQKILSVLRRNGSHTVIDMVTVRLDLKHDCYQADFSNLGLTGVPIDEEYPERFDRLLCGGIWCIVRLEYDSGAEEEERSGSFPITISNLTPIQMPHIDINELKEGRKAFTKDEWIDVILRSIGMEPDELSYREKWLLLLRCMQIEDETKRKAAMMAHLAAGGKRPAGGCPGSRMMQFKREENAAQPEAVAAGYRPVSRLNQWPCQIKLVPTQAPFFNGAKLLIAADCTAYAYANMHEDFMKGKITIIGCPKLDAVDYTEKLTAIMRDNDIKSVTIVRMEVPCCGGLQRAAENALKASGKFVPWQVVTISTDGRILD